MKQVFQQRRESFYIKTLNFFDKPEEQSEAGFRSATKETLDSS